MNALSLKMSGGGDDPPPSLTPQQRKEWNAYVDYVEKRGYRNSPMLDRKETGLATSLFNDFKKENPNTTISLDHIASVQSEMQNLAKAAQAFEARRGNPNAPNIMQGTSKVDSWPGSKTTSFKFPDMNLIQQVNSVPVSNTNLGILDSNLKPTDSLARKINTTVTTPLPAGVKLEKMADGYYYEDPKTGEWRKYSK